MYLSGVFKALGDKTRLRMLNLLSKQELCVCQICEVLKISQPNVSKHLHRMRYAGLIVCRKVSQWCFYKINEEFKSKNQALFAFLLDEWANNRLFAEDIQKLVDILNNFECCKTCVNKSMDL